MRIGLYTAFLTPGQIGGVETYLRQLISHLGQVDSRNRYTLFVTAQNRQLFTGLPENFERVQISLLPPGPFIVARLMHKLGVLPAYAARQMQRYPLEVLHYPGSTIDQPSGKFPCVLTLHDIQHEYFPEFFSPEEFTRRRANFKPSAVKAGQIITVSEYTRQTVINKYDIPPQKITAICYGIGQQFTTAIPPEMIGQIRQKYHLPSQFIYYPANPWPHKNHARLLEALARLRQQKGIICPLALSGVWSDQTELSNLITQYGLTEQVHLLGYLPYQELPALYRAATAMIFPSLFEGFGIPVLEAMACGCPVACADTTSLPEIAGEAALFFDPRNIAQISEVIYNVWDSEPLRNELSKKGFTRIKDYSWAQAARKTIAVYQQSL